MLQPGDIAPDLDVLDCRGERVRLSSYRGKKKVVLFFSPVRSRRHARSRFGTFATTTSASRRSTPS